jgi:thymidine phosphorylase
MILSEGDYKDFENLLSDLAEPLNSIAGNFLEIRETLDAILANGATVTISIKVGETLE